MAETTSFLVKKDLVLRYLGFQPLLRVPNTYYRQIKGDIQHVIVPDVYLDSSLCFEAIEGLSADGFTIKAFQNNSYKIGAPSCNSILVERNSRLITRVNFQAGGLQKAYWEAVIKTLENPF